MTAPHEHGILLSPERRAELANAEPDAARLAQMAGDMCVARRHFNADTQQAFYDTLLVERAAARDALRREMPQLKAQYEELREGIRDLRDQALSLLHR